jgi:hypothetical protein
MLSHVGDGAAKVTWLWHDVNAKSCWQWCCRVMLAKVLQVKVVRAVVRASRCCCIMKMSDIFVGL